MMNICSNLNGGRLTTLDLEKNSKMGEYFSPLGGLEGVGVGGLLNS